MHAIAIQSPIENPGLQGLADEHPLATMSLATGGIAAGLATLLTQDARVGITAGVLGATAAVAVTMLERKKMRRNPQRRGNPSVLGTAALLGLITAGGYVTYRVFARRDEHKYGQLPPPPTQDGGDIVANSTSGTTSTGDEYNARVYTKDPTGATMPGAEVWCFESYAGDPFYESVASCDMNYDDALAMYQEFDQRMRDAALA